MPPLPSVLICSCWSCQESSCFHSAFLTVFLSPQFEIGLLALYPSRDVGAHSRLLTMQTEIIMHRSEWKVYTDGGEWTHLLCLFRREQGVSGQPSSVMVEGIQVTLPSYEEAVYGSSGAQEPSGPPPSLPPPVPSESRVPIVLSEGPPRGAVGGQGPSRTRHHRDLDFCLPSTSSSSSSHRHAETVLVHQAPSSSSSSSSWATEHPGGACAAPLPLRRDSDSSDQHSLLSVTSTDEFSDGETLLV